MQPSSNDNVNDKHDHNDKDNGSNNENVNTNTYDDGDDICKMKKHVGHSSFNSCTGDGGLSWT